MVSETNDQRAGDLARVVAAADAQDEEVGKRETKTAPPGETVGDQADGRRRA